MQPDGKLFLVLTIRLKSVYDQYFVGKRLLVYTEVAAPDASNTRFPMEDRLEAVAKFAKLLERSDEEAMDTINQILDILKEVNNDITGI